MYRAQLIGSLSDIYTATQYSNGLTPLVGDWYYDENLKAKFIFLKMTGASSVAASLVVTALTTSKTTFGCELPAATNDLPFAGVRIVGATTLTQNTYGWFQISGSATLTACSSGTTAEKICVTSNTGSSEGKVETIASTYAVAMGPGTMIGIAETTTTSGVVKVSITSNIWGL